MAVINPPNWLQAGSYTAQQDRRMLSSLVGAGGGVAGQTDLTVQQRAAGANMSVDVLEGKAFVAGNEATTQGIYHCEAQGTTNLVIGAAHATLPRFDLIVARVRDAQYSGGTNAWALEVVAGTPNASPAEPSQPVNSIILARVSVAAAATSITNANIVDRRTRARVLGGVMLATSANLPSVLSTQQGDVAYATDIDSLYVRDASTWRPIGHARVVAPGNYTITSTYAAAASITLPTGRWLVHAKGTAVDTVGSRQIDVQLWNSTDSVALDEINIFAATAYRIPTYLMGSLANSTSKTIQLRARITGASSGHTLDAIRLWAVPYSVLL